MKVRDRVQLVVFRLDDRRYALPLDTVERIVRAVEVSALPGAPAVVHGAIDVGGEVLPVLNIRQRFLLPQREIGADDHFVIARSGRRTVALVIDEAHDVVEYEQSAIIDPNRIVPGLEHFLGVVTLDDGLVLIHDLEKFLSLDESRSLDEAMDRTE